MHRRSFLGALGASTLGLSGCVRASTIAERDESIWSNDTPFSVPAASFPEVTVRGVMDTPEDVDATVEVVQGFTVDAPATIRVSLTNVSEEQVEYLLSPSAPFSGYVSEEYNHAKMVIVPTQSNDHIDHVVPDSLVDGLISGNKAVSLPPQEPVRGCWTLPGHISVTDVGEWVQLAPGESIAEEFAVLNTAGNVRCLPKGKYRFVSEDHFGDGESWGFTLVLSSPR